MSPETTLRKVIGARAHKGAWPTLGLNLNRLNRNSRKSSAREHLESSRSACIPGRSLKQKFLMEKFLIGPPGNWFPSSTRLPISLTGTENGHRSRGGRENIAHHETMKSSPLGDHAFASSESNGIPVYANPQPCFNPEDSSDSHDSPRRMTDRDSTPSPRCRKVKFCVATLPHSPIAQEVPDSRYRPGSRVFRGKLPPLRISGSAY